MLLAGEIDAILSAIPPKSFIAGNPNMVRLVPNYVEVEADYFKRTGIFPIMHFVAIKRPLFERHPWMAVNLYRAFEEAKERSVARIKQYDGLAFPAAVESRRLGGAPARCSARISGPMASSRTARRSKHSSASP